MEMQVDNKIDVNNLNNKLENNLISSMEVDYNSQKSFLETTLGKTINGAVDIGLKIILPDLIEDQIINIKDTLLSEGLKEGIKKTIDTAIDFGKSALGIVTGKFDNVSQVQTAIEKGGIMDTFSNVFDKVLNKISNKGLLNKDIGKLIKKGKNVILENVASNIENDLTNQIKSVEKLKKYSNKWKKHYEQKDFNNMEKEYKNIKSTLNNLIPLETTIKKGRIIENIHNLIKNNGQDFNLTTDQIELAQKLA